MLESFICSFIRQSKKKKNRFLSNKLNSEAVLGLQRQAMVQMRMYGDL